MTEHSVSFHAATDPLPTLHIVTFPGSCHGPQLQYPRTAAKHIAAFVQAAHD